MVEITYLWCMIIINLSLKLWPSKFELPSLLFLFLNLNTVCWVLTLYYLDDNFYVYPSSDQVELCDDDEFIVLACDGIWYASDPLFFFLVCFNVCEEKYECMMQILQHWRKDETKYKKKFDFFIYFKEGPRSKLDIFFKVRFITLYVH